ncbi:MAG: DUF1501 domain-containing protein [Pirellulaceae bacterium]|nr:DUF1501 domain-containing protein [Pirellulaceae bacterium]
MFNRQFSAHLQRGHGHAFTSFNALDREGLVVASRRNMLKASMTGMAGLSLPGLLAQRASGAASAGKGKSVILLWMSGGPSHIDTWDPKPDRPAQNRGPFGVISTKLPGVQICEHLPKQAAMLDRFTVIRSVDAKRSNHEPNMVFQTGNLDAEPRVNPESSTYPAIASIVAQKRGPGSSGLPPYIGFYRSRSHIAFGGAIGQQYDPFQGNSAAQLPIYDLVGTDSGKKSSAEMFQFPGGLDFQRLQDRRKLLTDLDSLRREIDSSGTMAATDVFQQQAVELLLGEKARQAFDLSREPEAMRQRYGNHLWCQQALLARRLVEAGVAFVTLDLSYHTASGTWDNHGDNIPPYGGISRGLKPLLPLYDHLVTTLVGDLEERGKLDDVLVISMGEFGRTPNMGTQGSTDGRDHWPNIMSMCLAGGGLRHGQVIGASERDGGSIRERPVRPGDLAATLYQYFGVPLETQYIDHRGRPRNVVENGEPIAELF